MQGGIAHPLMVITLCAFVFARAGFTLRTTGASYLKIGCERERLRAQNNASKREGWIRT